MFYCTSQSQIYIQFYWFQQSSQSYRCSINSIIPIQIAYYAYKK
ncbi:hypothetical protein pb186bvf_017957 [Paramecium bursaria]